MIKDIQVVHHHPALGEKVDSAVNAELRKLKGEPASKRRFEKLATRKIADNVYEVCCIPFLIPDLALGDEIEADTFGSPDLVMKKVRKRSGNSTFWVYFKVPYSNAARQTEQHQQVLQKLAELNCFVEGAHAGLIAFNAQDVMQAYVAMVSLVEESKKDILNVFYGKTEEACLWEGAIDEELIEEVQRFSVK